MPWINRIFGEVNYYVITLLRYYVTLKKYLHRMSKTVSDYCLYEEGEVIDHAGDIFFECVRWQSYRSVLTSVIGMITAAKIVAVMIVSR